jgi:tetratricopeptide (TPR) repeat protein
VGDRVIVLGAPLGFEQSVSEGIVGAVRVVAEEGLPKIPVLQITAPISHGSSGGPVINYQGEVVGVVSFLFLHGQNLNFAIPVQYVRQLQTGAVQPLAKAMLAPETIQAQASYERGVKLYDKKNYQQALTAFLTAVDLYPRYPKAYNYLGLACRHLDKYEEAQKAFLQAMKLNPQNAVYVYNLGMLYYHAEHYKDAVQAFANAAKLAPKDPDAYFMLGKACLQIKNRVVAVQCYQVLTKLDPGKAQELYKLINK